ncbi:MAG: hypothetical protein FWG64_13040 [Firmicutes bacterium]|nr:hypothetical protein [Bacillota bacterium]
MDIKRFTDELIEDYFKIHPHYNKDTGSIGIVKLNVIIMSELIAMAIAKYHKEQGKQ